ncbi:MAG: hypothetical protein ABI690_25625 [Chloroflexota bacterium]
MWPRRYSGGCVFHTHFFGLSEFRELDIDGWKVQTQRAFASLERSQSPEKFSLRDAPTSECASLNEILGQMTRQLGSFAEVCQIGKWFRTPHLDNHLAVERSSSLPCCKLTDYTRH